MCFMYSLHKIITIHSGMVWCWLSSFINKEQPLNMETSDTEHWSMWRLITSSSSLKYLYIYTVYSIINSNDQDCLETEQKCPRLFPTKGTSCCWAWHGRTTDRHLLQYTSSTVFGFCFINDFFFFFIQTYTVSVTGKKIKGTVSSTI